MRFGFDRGTGEWLRPSEKIAEKSIDEKHDIPCVSPASCHPDAR